MAKPGEHEVVTALMHDVELLWQTLEFNAETIKMLDRPGPERPRSTDRCSDNTVCTGCSHGGCVMTVYH